MLAFAQDAFRTVAPLGFTLGGLLAGLALERFGLEGLERRLEQRDRHAAARAVAAFHGALAVILAALGAQATLLSYPIRRDIFDAAEKTLLVVVVIAVTLVAARVAAGALGEFLRRRREAAPSASLFMSLATLGVWSLGGLVALQSVGIAITPILTAVGVGGLAVALALKDTLSNLFSGLQIIASRQLRPGDYVKLESGSEGYVADITWRNTTIRDLADNLVVVPNDKLAQSIFTNYALPERGLKVAVPIFVPYDADLARVEAVTLEVARSVLQESGSLAGGFEPFVRFQELGNENVRMTAYLRADEFVDQFQLRSKFVKRVHARFRDEGIRAPFPARTSIEAAT